MAQTTMSAAGRPVAAWPRSTIEAASVMRSRTARTRVPGEYDLAQSRAAVTLGAPMAPGP